MNILSYEDRKSIIDASVAHILTQIQEHKDHFVLGVSTGLTVLDICAELANQCQQQNISLRHVKIFLAGEFVGFSKQHQHHHMTMLDQKFFSKIDVLTDNIHTIDGQAQDLEEESHRFESKIIECGGMDLFVGSLGANGNVAFNEPGASLSSRTRLKTLATETAIADARFFENVARVPTKAITMGIGTIFDARQILMVAYGIQKAFVLRQSITEPVSDNSPASIFQLHEKVTFMIDKVVGRFLPTSLGQ